ELTARLGLRETALRDRVRNKREAHHPPTLSHGSAAELAGLLGGLARRELISAAVSERVDRWLATNTDLSMVASAFDLDPLAQVSTCDRTRGPVSGPQNRGRTVGRTLQPGPQVRLSLRRGWFDSVSDGAVGALLGRHQDPQQRVDQQLAARDDQQDHDEQQPG